MLVFFNALNFFLRDSLSLTTVEFDILPLNSSPTLSHASWPKGRRSSTMVKRMSNSAVDKVEPLPFFVMVTEKCESLSTQLIAQSASGQTSHLRISRLKLHHLRKLLKNYEYKSPQDKSILQTIFWSAIDLRRLILRISKSVG